MAVSTELVFGNDESRWLIWLKIDSRSKFTFLQVYIHEECYGWSRQMMPFHLRCFLIHLVLPASIRLRYNVYQQILEEKTKIGPYAPSVDRGSVYAATMAVATDGSLWVAGSGYNATSESQSPAVMEFDVERQIHIQEHAADGEGTEPMRLISGWWELAASVYEPLSGTLIVAGKRTNTSAFMLQGYDINTGNEVPGYESAEINTVEPLLAYWHNADSKPFLFIACKAANHVEVFDVEAKKFLACKVFDAEVTALLAPSGFNSLYVAQNNLELEIVDLLVERFDIERFPDFSVK